MRTALLLLLASLAGCHLLRVASGTSTSAQQAEAAQYVSDWLWWAATGTVPAAAATAAIVRRRRRRHKEPKP